MVRRGAKRTGRAGRDGKGRRTGSSPRSYYVLRKKKCRFCMDKNIKINYLDFQFLRRFTTERGKVIPSRISGSCAKHQRKLAKAIKRARNIGLLPFLASE